jgi:hypothetical protein
LPIASRNHGVWDTRGKFGEIPEIPVMSPAMGFVLPCRMSPVFAEGSEFALWFSPLGGARLHYPLGLLAVAVLLEAWAIRRPGPRLRNAIGSLLGIAAVLAWIVVGLGLARVQEGDLRTGQLQQFFAATLATLCTFAWWLHRQVFPRGAGLHASMGRRTLVVMTLVASILAGFEGGEPRRSGRSGFPPGSLGLASLQASGERLDPPLGPEWEPFVPVPDRGCVQSRARSTRRSGLGRRASDLSLLADDPASGRTGPINW